MRDIRVMLTGLILTSGIATALIVGGVLDGDGTIFVPLILVAAIVAQWNVSPKRRTARAKARAARLERGTDH